MSDPGSWTQDDHKRMAEIEAFEAKVRAEVYEQYNREWRNQQLALFRWVARLFRRRRG